MKHKKALLLGAIVLAAILLIAIYVLDEISMHHTRMAEQDHRDVQSLTRLGNGMQLYSNSSLGYKVTIPATWKVDAARSSVDEIVFDRGAGPEDHTSIDVQPTTGTLNSLVAALVTNPLIFDVASTTIDGEPAVLFQSHELEGGAIITVYDGNQFTFNPGADVWSAPILSTFKFTD